MTTPSSKPLTAHFAVALVIACALLWFGIQLRRFAEKDRQLVATIRLMATGTGAHAGCTAGFKQNIEQQLSRNSLPELEKFKTDSMNYPRNVAAYIFTYAPDFGVVLQDMKQKNDTLFCRLLVRDKIHFYITARFIQQGNIYLLDDLEHAGALFNRIECHNQYVNTVKH